MGMIGGIGSRVKFSAINDKAGKDGEPIVSTLQGVITAMRASGITVKADDVPASKGKPARPGKEYVLPKEKIEFLPKPPFPVGTAEKGGKG